MAEKPKDEKFSAEETQKRFEAALRGARVAGHKPQTVSPSPKKNAPVKKKTTAPKNRRLPVKTKS